MNLNEPFHYLADITDRKKMLTFKILTEECEQ